YGAARGAEMLSMMLGFGIVSRLLSGWLSDHIGGLRTLLLGSALQGVALLLFLPFDGLASLYVISALFGLFQGGIVPSYAIIIREHFGARRAGGRVAFEIVDTGRPIEHPAVGALPRGRALAVRLAAATLRRDGGGCEAVSRGGTTRVRVLGTVAPAPRASARKTGAKRSARKAGRKRAAGKKPVRKARSRR
ncbi:MAG TPA: MFS transporter, partial [Myxococcota bacterium]|nr:MFS transporter [Myxococcota bacterium]